MTEFAWEYLFFVLLSAIGVMFIVTGYNRLNGLLLFGRRTSIILGMLLVVGTFVWFFVSKPRNVPDTGAGLDGNQQALLFATGVISGLLIVLALSAWRNWSMAGETHQDGVEALRTSNYIRLFGKEVRSWWNHFYKWTKEHSSG